MYRKRGVGGIHLTFDDGPHPGNTPVILETLARHGARATFFLQGSEVERYPWIARDIVRGGHAIGSHLYSHRSPRKMSPGDLEDEMVRTERILGAETGAAVRLLRPPYGDLTARLLWSSIRRKQSVILWSFDSEDSFFTSRERLINKVCERRFLAGDILLFHDDCLHTVEALPWILEFLAGRGHKFSAL